MKLKDRFFNLFGKNKTTSQNMQAVQLLNDYTARIINYSDNAYDNLIYRACIDRISSQVAKLTPHIKGDLQKVDKFYSNLPYLLQHKPNEYMSRYDFFYKITTMLLDTNNVFIYKRVVNNQITGFYPIDFSQIELVQANDVIFAQFSFKNSTLKVTIPFDELIILRRHFNNHEIFGSEQKDSLTPIFEVVKAIDSGLINSVEASGKLRGILKYTQQLKESDLERFKNQFVDSYMKLGAGIGALDIKADFQPVDVKPQTIDSENAKLVLQNFGINYGVSENVLKGCASEAEMNAFYELAIEPLMTQYSLEFTNKIFTRQAIEENNEILFTGNKLLFASVATKTTLAEKMMPAGVFSINDIREMYGFNPIENGDKHIMSLNYIDLDKANEYQVGAKDENVE